MAARGSVGTWAATLALAAGLMAPTAPGAAPAASGERVQVEGEIIDTWCYLSGVMGGQDAVVGSAHHTCAMWCAAGGIPVGLLGDDGEVYMVLKWAGSDDVDVALPVGRSGERFLIPFFDGFTVQVGETVEARSQNVRPKRLTLCNIRLDRLQMIPQRFDGQRRVSEIAGQTAFQITFQRSGETRTCAFRSDRDCDGSPINDGWRDEVASVGLVGRVDRNTQSPRSRRDF